MKHTLTIAGAVLALAGLGLLGAGAAHLGEAPAKLTWTAPEFRSALMTFAYKVYGNPKMEAGRHYLSKLTFKNAGQRPVTDFSISYKLQDYIPWTDPESVAEIPAGFSFAKLFYPRLPADVTKLRTATTCALQVKVRWKENGQQREQTFKHDVLLRAVNELAYCDLPANEVESWLDAFDASSFAVSMVTPNDPVVSAYAAEITKQAGGTTAGIAGGPKEVYRLCQVAYDYMCRTGLRYTGDSGVPMSFDGVRSVGQVVRLPRDVIQNNNGLCIELAILWASVLEHLGVTPALVMIPGHCYVIAYSPQAGLPLSNGFPVECTAITPRAVGEPGSVPFDKAVKMAQETTEKAFQDGRMIMLPVPVYQEMGFTAPELPDVDVAKVTEMLEKRLAPNPAANFQNAPRVAQQNSRPPAPTQPEEGDDVPAQAAPPEQELPTQQAGRNTVNWRHPSGYVSIDFPTSFRTFKPPINPGNVLLLVAGNPATTMECDVMQVVNTEDPGMAWSYIAKSCAKHSIRLKLENTKLGDGGMVFYSGTTNNHGTLSRWVAEAKPVPNGVVFVSAGVSLMAWDTQRGNVMGLMGNVHFK